MKKYLFFLLFSLASFLQAQDSYSKIFDLYGNTLDFGNSTEAILTIKKDGDELLLGMASRCDDFTIDCAILARTDLQGDTLWTKVIDWLDPGSRALEKKGDTLIMAGHNAPTLENFYLYYMTLGGDSIMTVELYPPEGYYEVRIGGVIQYGEYSVVYGTANEEGQDGFVGLAHWVSAEGVLDTTLIFDDADVSDNIWDVDIDPEGNLAFLIDKKDIVPGPNPYQIVRKNVIKFNAEKELIWEWETDNENPLSGDIPGRMEILDDGNIILNADAGSELREEIWAIGDTGVTWKYIYPLSNTLRMYIVNLKETLNGDMIGCGWIVDQNISNGLMGYLFRMSKDGEMIWERAIVDSNNEVPDKNMGSNLREIIELDDGTILAGGWINTWFYNDENEETRGLDAWLIRTDANGCIIENCEYIQDFTTSIPVFSDPIHIDLFPNPTSDFLTIRWPAEFPIEELQVYDSMGRLVWRQNNPSISESIDLAHMAPGIYAVVLVDENGRRYGEKVLVE